MHGMVNGSFTIVAYDEKGGRNGHVDLTFRNFPIDAPTVQFVSNMLLTIGVEATSVLKEGSTDG